ncbi:MAG: periplasmic glucan biosynthesis protein MdoG [Hyphomicrobiales bacterium]|nr:periplasmic glucan biosynthesis protein MdoG [Hyphomicrobiales bacterium]
MAAGGAFAQAPAPAGAPEPPAADPRGPKFDAAMVQDAARALAKQPWKKPPQDVSETYAALNYDQYSSIARKPEARIWNGQKVGFVLEPTHRGFIFTNHLQINVVEDGYARRLAYDAQDFASGKAPPTTDKRDVGFAGFRILQTAEDGSTKEVLLFQGAGYFQTAARGQPFGAASRALSIRPVDQTKGEEFPYIAQVWIERPVLAANALIVHAVLDSESVTGAYRFTLRPGDTTIVDTECTLFTRAALDHVGLGTLQGTFLFGPIDRRRGDDIRPSVYDVSGLQMLSGGGEWIWRPASNRQTLQASAFVDENPRGFGLLQRDRDFALFNDDDSHWEARPSVWTEPIGDWGPGHVTLLEIPAESQVNQNIVAYWRPRAPLAANAEASFAYRQFWCWSPPERPPFAIAARSRSGRMPGAQNNLRRRRFLVEFTGDLLNDTARYPEITAKAHTAQGNITNVRLVMAREDKAARVLFDVDAGTEPHAELRLFLEAAGKPISETWLYRWTP